MEFDEISYAYSWVEYLGCYYYHYHGMVVVLLATSFCLFVSICKHNNSRATWQFDGICYTHPWMEYLRRGWWRVKPDEVKVIFYPLLDPIINFKRSVSLKWVQINTWLQSTTNSKLYVCFLFIVFMVLKSLQSPMLFQWIT